MTARVGYGIGIIAIACSLGALAAAGDNPGPSREAQRTPAVNRLPRPIVRMFDADGSGQLDDAERAKARRAMAAKFDKDGDGRLDEKERAAVREWLAASRRGQAARPASPEAARRKQAAKQDPARPGADRAAKPDQPPRGQAEMRQQRAAQQQRRAARQGQAPDFNQVRRMILRAYDADRDGRLSAEEARKLRADLAPLMRAQAPRDQAAAAMRRRARQGAPNRPARPNRPADSQAQRPTGN